MKKLHALITRPRHQSMRLCEAIAARGGITTLFPTIEIISLLDEQKLHELVNHFQHADIVIFTSANAVQQIINNNLILPSRMQIAAIGPATAQALEVVDILPAQFSSEGLLAHEALQQISNKTVLIITGNNGRELLPKTLHARGAHVMEYPVYKRTIPHVDMAYWLPILQNSALDVVISTSNESLLNLMMLVGHDADSWLKQKQLLVISQRMRDVVVQMNFVKEPIIASNASTDAIIFCLEEWWERKNCFSPLQRER